MAELHVLTSPQILTKQIGELSESPENLNRLPHKMTIFHQLMSKDAWKNGTVPVPGSLYEESQALMFGGGDTTGNALMVTTFHVAKRPEIYKKLKAELKSAWSSLDETPSLKSLEHLPYLNAVIKEGLRMSTGVVSGLARMVPSQGAKICGAFIPAGVSSHAAHLHMDCPNAMARQSFLVAVLSYTITRVSSPILMNLDQNGGLRTLISTAGWSPFRVGLGHALASSTYQWPSKRTPVLFTDASTVWLGWNCAWCWRT